MQPHWVGDLTLETNLEITKVAPGGSVRLELIKAGAAASLHDRPRHRHCRCDPRRARARSSGRRRSRGRDATSSSSPTSTIASAWSSMGAQSAAMGSNSRPNDAVPIPTAADLAPAAIAARNASVVASDLVLKRDIYYTQTPGRVDYGIVWEDRFPRTPKELFDFLSDPVAVSQPRQCKVA